MKSFSLAAERNPGGFGFVRCTGLVRWSVRFPLIRLDETVGEEIGFDFVAAHIRQHLAVHFNAGAEHLAAFFNHFLALRRIVDDVAVFEREVVLAHDRADTLAPAAGRFQISDNLRLLHIHNEQKLPYVPQFTIMLVDQMARDFAVINNFAQAGRVFAATIFGNRTAGMERTTGRRIQRRRNIACQNNALPFQIGIDHRNRGDQGLGVRVPGVLANFCGVARFDDSAKIHHEDSLADMLYNGQIVGDEQIRQVVFALEINEQINNLRLDGNVERAHSFVTNDELRFNGEGTRDADPLALTAAEFMRVTIGVHGLQSNIG